MVAVFDSDSYYVAGYLERRPRLHGSVVVGLDNVNSHLRKAI